MYYDLLDSRVFHRLVTNPSTIEDEMRAAGQTFAIIDEIQKAPTLLDEVHRLHEMGLRFGLCGSSARKVRRRHANLLGGRALRFHLFGLTATELGNDFALPHMLNHGYFPRIYGAKSPKRYLRAYVADYLKEEIAAEGLSRKLQAFDDFLRQAALSDTKPLNASTIARECGIASSTVANYFQVLEDTLLGSFLPAFTRRPKRRVIKSPKFFFCDVGVVNLLARRGSVEFGSQACGPAFENWVYHELCAYNEYAQKDADMSYWQLSSGIEVDFLINDIDVAIEVKASSRIRTEHLGGLRELKREYPNTRRMIVVSLTKQARTTQDGIEIIDVDSFVDQLWSGSLW